MFNEGCKILDLEENWRKIKDAINIHKGRCHYKHRYWPGTPAGPTPACVTRCRSYDMTVKIKSTEEGCQMQPKYTEKTKTFLRGKTITKCFRQV